MFVLPKSVPFCGYLYLKRCLVCCSTLTLQTFSSLNNIFSRVPFHLLFRFTTAGYILLEQRQRSYLRHIGQQSRPRDKSVH